MIEFKLRLRCRTHPGYMGARKPRVDCKDCEAIHLARKDPGQFLHLLFGKSVYVEMGGTWKQAQRIALELPPDA